MRTDLNFLRTIDFLSEADTAWLERIAEDLEYVELAAQQVLFSEDEPGDALFLIIEGAIRLESRGHEVLQRAAGSYVGELAVIDDGRRSATATAITPVQLFRWPKPAFLRAFGDGGGLPALYLCRGIAAKLRDDFRQWSGLVNDLNIAGDVQRALLPGAELVHAPYEVFAKCRQMDSVGGDFYDFRALPDGKLLLAVFDVEGHGMPAALMAAFMKSRLDEAIERKFEPTEMMRFLDRALIAGAGSSESLRTATGCIVTADPETRSIFWSNAGHPSQYLMRQNGSLHRLKSNGWLLGLSDEGRRTTGKCEFRSGDLVLLFTDGLTEAKDPSGCDLGASGVERCLSACRCRHPQELLKWVLECADKHSRNAKPGDDIAVIAAQLSP